MRIKYKHTTTKKYFQFWSSADLKGTHYRFPKGRVVKKANGKNLPANRAMGKCVVYNTNQGNVARSKCGKKKLRGLCKVPEEEETTTVPLLLTTTTRPSNCQ